MTLRKDKEAAGIATRNDALIVAERIAELRRRRKAHAETAPYRFMTEECAEFAAIGGSFYTTDDNVAMLAAIRGAITFMERYGKARR